MVDDTDNLYEWKQGTSVETFNVFFQPNEADPVHKDSDLNRKPVKRMEEIQGFGPPMPMQQKEEEKREEAENEPKESEKSADEAVILSCVRT